MAWLFYSPKAGGGKMGLSFNRNVITRDDIERLRTATTRAELPKTLSTNPPAGDTTKALQAGAVVPAAPPPAGGGGPPGGVPVPSEDDYLTKLLKYVPLEVVGAYLFLEGVVDSNVTKPHDRAVWLGGLLLGVLLLTIVYDVRVLNVVRLTQIVMSLVGLTVYIFAAGGWFATTTWYQHWYASIALPIFGLLVAVIKLKPLPAVGA
jgi:hypothetical protein